MKKLAICVVVLVSLTATVKAQTSTDTLATELRRYVARNFSEARTFNLYWETSPNHNYTLKQNGSQIESGEMRVNQTVKFAATVPVLLLKKFSLYASGQSNFYMFETYKDADGLSSSIFPDNEENYSYYKGTVRGTYRTKAFGKPLIMTAAISGDGWNSGFEKVSGDFSALMVFKHSATTSLSAGLYGTTLFNQVPVVPIIVFWHQFNPNLSIDITLPSKVFLRYQFKDSHRLSIGTSMESEQYYLKSGMADLPKVCYYESATIKPEIVYEFIVNKHFYFIARAGGTGIIKGGLYNTNRKGIDGDPYISLSSPMTPFLNLGFSYNIF